MRRDLWPLWMDWALTGAWMGVIYYWSSQAHPDIPGIDFDPFRKSLHAFEYLLLFVLWGRAIRPYAGDDDVRRMIWALALTAAYAVSDEAHQHFVGRYGNLRDVLIDTALPAALTLLTWARRRKALPARPDHPSA